MNINPSQSQLCQFEYDVRLCISGLGQPSRERIYVCTNLWSWDKSSSWNHKKHTDTENDRPKSPRIISCIHFTINGPGTYFTCQTQCWWPHSDEEMTNVMISDAAVTTYEKILSLWLVSPLPSRPLIGHTGHNGMRHWTQSSHWARGQWPGAAPQLSKLSTGFTFRNKLGLTDAEKAVMQAEGDNTDFWTWRYLIDWRSIKLCINKELHILNQWHFNDT